MIGSGQPWRQKDCPVVLKLVRRQPGRQACDESPIDDRRDGHLDIVIDKELQGYPATVCFQSALPKCMYSAHTWAGSKSKHFGPVPTSTLPNLDTKTPGRFLTSLASERPPDPIAEQHLPKIGPNPVLVRARRHAPSSRMMMHG